MTKPRNAKGIPRLAAGTEPSALLSILFGRLRLKKQVLAACARGDDLQRDLLLEQRDGLARVHIGLVTGEATP
ncbi:MAG: hypothetical protein H0X39_00300 [Actinobacteria bacterium]|nr:hypothetical protein [Gemmatimonadaceae bacterium]MBA3841061.1 hypothetical protein [Actinomycetota bacterium]